MYVSAKDPFPTILARGVGNGRYVVTHVLLCKCYRLCVRHHHHENNTYSSTFLVRTQAGLEFLVHTVETGKYYGA